METPEIILQKPEVQILTLELLLCLPPDERKRRLGEYVQYAVDEGLYDQSEMVDDIVDDVMEYDFSMRKEAS